MNRHILHPAYIPFFLAFRLVLIPASILTHTGHGLPWLTAGLGCAATLGAEWLTRRMVATPLVDERRRDLVVVVLALIFLGFFPEEGPIGLILWAGIGAAWGAATRGVGFWSTGGPTVAAALAAGALLGASGLFGPGSWLAAAVLGLGVLGLAVWRGRESRKVGAV